MSRLNWGKNQALGIISEVESGGVMKASSVVWRKKKDVSLRLCAEIELFINDSIMAGDYTLPD